MQVARALGGGRMVLGVNIEEFGRDKDVMEGMKMVSRRRMK